MCIPIFAHGPLCDAWPDGPSVINMITSRKGLYGLLGTREGVIFDLDHRKDPTAPEKDDLCICAVDIPATLEAHGIAFTLLDDGSYRADVPDLAARLMKAERGVS